MKTRQFTEFLIVLIKVLRHAMLPLICKHLFLLLCLFNFTAVFHSFTFGTTVSPHKSNGMIGKSVALTPNLESSFSHNYFTRPGETSGSSKDMGMHYKCVCLGLDIMKKRSKVFHESKDWSQRHEHCLDIQYIKHIHTIWSNLTSFPLQMDCWRLCALGGLGANLTEFLADPIGNCFGHSHALVSAVYCGTKWIQSALS